MSKFINWLLGKEPAPRIVYFLIVTVLLLMTVAVYNFRGEE